MHPDQQIANLSEFIEKGLHLSRCYIEMSTKCRRPTDEEVLKITVPLNDLSTKLLKQRNSPINYVKAIEEAFTAFYWPFNHGTTFIDAAIEATDFYLNRVLKDKKEEKQWVESIKKILNELRVFVEEHFKAGLIWNMKGSAPKVPVASSTEQEAKQEVITPTAAPIVKKQTIKPKSITKDPIFELQNGTKWVVANQPAGTRLSVKIESINQSVSIRNCHDCFISMNGKCNNVVIDSCTRSGFIFDSIIAGCEMMKGGKNQLQFNGSLPLIHMENTSGNMLWLTKQSINADVITSCVTETAVYILPDTDHDSEVEPLVVPSQYVHRVSNGKLTTTVLKTLE